MKEVMYKLKDGLIVDAGYLHNAFHVLYCNDGYGAWHLEGYNTGEYIRFLNSLFKNGSIVWYGFPTFEELARSTNKIYAIKMYRDEHGCTLREAKDYVDSLTA